MSDFKISIARNGGVAVEVDGVDLTEYVEGITLVAEGKGSTPELMLAVRVGVTAIEGIGSVSTFNPAEILREALGNVDHESLSGAALERLGVDTDNPMEAMVLTILDALETEDGH